MAAPYRIPNRNPLLSLLRGAGKGYLKSKGAWPGEDESEYKMALLRLKERELESLVTHREAQRELTRELFTKKHEQELDILEAGTTEFFKKIGKEYEERTGYAKQLAKYNDELATGAEKRKFTTAKQLAEYEATIAEKYRIMEWDRQKPEREADIALTKQQATESKARTEDMPLQRDLAERRISATEQRNADLKAASDALADLSKERFTWERQKFYLEQIDRIADQEWDAQTQAWILQLKAVSEASMAGTGMPKQLETYYQGLFRFASDTMYAIATFKNEEAREELINELKAISPGLERYAKRVGETYKTPEILFRRKGSGIPGVPGSIRKYPYIGPPPDTSSKVSDTMAAMAAKYPLSTVELPFEADDREVFKDTYGLNDTEIDELESVLGQLQAPGTQAPLGPPTPTKVLPHPGAEAAKQRKKLLQTKLKEVSK